jgi:hypothetical protein
MRLGDPEFVILLMPEDGQRCFPNEMWALQWLARTTVKEVVSNMAIAYFGYISFLNFDVGRYEYVGSR